MRNFIFVLSLVLLQGLLSGWTSVAHSESIEELLMQETEITDESIINELAKNIDSNKSLVEATKQLVRESGDKKAIELYQEAKKLVQKAVNQFGNKEYELAIESVSLANEMSMQAIERAQLIIEEKAKARAVPKGVSKEEVADKLEMNESYLKAATGVINEYKGRYDTSRGEADLKRATKIHDDAHNAFDEGKYADALKGFSTSTRISIALITALENVAHARDVRAVIGGTETFDKEKKQIEKLADEAEANRAFYEAAKKVVAEMADIKARGELMAAEADAELANNYFEEGKYEDASKAYQRSNRGYMMIVTRLENLEHAGEKQQIDKLITATRGQSSLKSLKVKSGISSIQKLIDAAEKRLKAKSNAEAAALVEQAEEQLLSAKVNKDQSLFDAALKNIKKARSLLKKAFGLMG